MTKMRTTYLGTEILHEQSGNKIITDAPLDNHGKGEYFSPTDIFASSLASCMLTIMGISAQSYGFNIDGTTVEIEKEMAANPRRVARIVVDITFPKGQRYDDKAKRLIVRSPHLPRLQQPPSRHHQGHPLPLRRLRH